MSSRQEEERLIQMTDQQQQTQQPSTSSETSETSTDEKKEENKTKPTTKEDPEKKKKEEEKEEEEEEEVVSISEYSRMTVVILIPVAITMIITVILVRILNMSGGTGVTIGTLVYQEDSNDSTGEKLLGSVLNALIFLGVILLTTVVFVLLYYFHCIKIIIGWLVGSTTLLLGTIGGYFLLMIISSLNLPLDWITLCFLMWNFAVSGVVAVFWLAPKTLNRAYLITVSFLVAGYFTQLPEWTTWAILVMIAIYDVFAVLCPRGPLKILVETAQKRKEPIPALLYNGSIVMMMAEEENSSTGKTKQNSASSTSTSGGATATVHPEKEATQKEEGKEPQVEEEEEEEKGVKLGLGDFIFYSVLVGRAALYDMLTVFTSFIAILTGLFGTLLLLGIFRKALPALPISITLGVIFYFLSRIFLIPFVASNGLELAFI